MLTREVPGLGEHEEWMRAALEEARLAARLGEVPVGAVVVREGELLGRGHNIRESEKSPLGHGELVAITSACQAVGDWRLSGCTLYVTLEPCCMCAGACLNARLERVVYGAADPLAGCLGSRIDLFRMELEGAPPPRILGGVLEEDCAALLREFFLLQRRRDTGGTPAGAPRAPARKPGKIPKKHP